MRASARQPHELVELAGKRKRWGRRDRRGCSYLHGKTAARRPGFVAILCDAALQAAAAIKSNRYICVSMHIHTHTCYVKVLLWHYIEESAVFKTKNLTRVRFDFLRYHSLYVRELDLLEITELKIFAM